MATDSDGDVIFALALCIVARRDMYRDTAEAAAERRGWTMPQLFEALEWFLAVEPDYRGGELMAAAERMATAIRLPTLRHASDAPEPELWREKMAGRPGNTFNDPPDPTRPERPCARCGTSFQPTLRRRMLCAPCYLDDDHSVGLPGFSVGERANIHRHGARAPTDRNGRARLPWRT